MVVFIGNIPKFAVEKELLRLTGLGPGTPLRIIKKPARNGAMLRYALVPTANRKQAQRLIDRLNGYDWRGHVLSVRYYHQRAGVNERRRVDWRRLAWSGAERRCRERRGMVEPQKLRVA